MNKKEMLVLEALDEMKLLDKRIEKLITSTNFVAVHLVKDTTIGGITTEEWTEKVKSTYDSIIDLIAYRKAIRLAIAQSNATTMIEDPRGGFITISQALESIKDHDKLHSSLTSHLAASWKVAQANYSKYGNMEIITADAEKYATGIYTQLTSANVGVGNNVVSVESLKNDYIAQHTYEYVDPIDIKKQIEKLSEESEGYLSKLQSLVNISNAKTTITVEW